MPKIIELTVEINVQRVSCPGVWLCQDGRCSLTIYALNTSYQTCLLPPVFPMMFKDVFYFRKQFQETCALNNICCLLKNEAIYCELVQWCESCKSGEYSILAQYLGTLNNILFPPNMCSNDGVDLLMRRSNNFPGILSPKIEITTKVRIDEVWDHQISKDSIKKGSCHCTSQLEPEPRQRTVCHSPNYHRSKCMSTQKISCKSKSKRSRSQSRSRSGGSRSCCSLTPYEPETAVSCTCPKSKDKPLTRPRIYRPVCDPCPPFKPIPKGFPHRRSRCRRSVHCDVFNVDTMPDANWTHKDRERYSEDSDNEDEEQRPSCDADRIPPSHSIPERLEKVLLESQYIEQNSPSHSPRRESRRLYSTRTDPCVCEICEKYYKLFHKNLKGDS